MAKLGRPTTRTPEEKRQQQRKANKAYRDRLHIIKEEIFNDFTACIACGINNRDLIDWHHVDPSTKKDRVGVHNKQSLDLWWDELLKCVPVCCNCHRLIHKEKLCLLKQI